MLVFWAGATASQGGLIFGWAYSDFATYYLLLALTDSLIVAHVEEDVAVDDVNRGQLSVFLLKPRPYYAMKLMSELPWRFTQGVFSIITILIVALLARNIIHITSSPVLLLLAIVIALLAYLMSFSFKMCLGLMAFWFTEINSLMQLTEIIMTVSGGIIIPLLFLPSSIKIIFDILPFSYMIYYPIVALLGKLDYRADLQVIIIQVVWLVVFSLLYKILLRAGIRTFTAVGI